MLSRIRHRMMELVLAIVVIAAATACTLPTGTRDWTCEGVVTDPAENVAGDSIASEGTCEFLEGSS